MTTTTATTTIELAVRATASRARRAVAFARRAVASAPFMFTRAREDLRGVPWSLRTRIVAWFIALLALATVSSVLVTREVLLLRLDQRIDSELVQETAELRRLALGKDPETGKAFGPRVKRIFQVYLKNNVPSQNEAFVTFVGGRPYLRSRPVVPYRLDRDQRLVSLWATLAEPRRGSVETPAGRVEYHAIPLLAGGEAAGVFVAAVFRDRAKAEPEAATWAMGAAGLAVLLLGSLLAWRLANRIVQPVTALTTTARSISETDLSNRIPERGRDEVAQLAATFNQMLDRLEHAFEAQGRFVDDAGHELRTPLTIVSGHLQLLEADPDGRSETLALMNDELERMGRIVEDLLVLAKHQQPDFLALTTLDAGALTQEVHAKLRALAPRQWVLEQHEAGVIVGDRHRLTQAIFQLAQNAARYSDDEEPIALGSKVADGEARFWVRDHGPGVAPEEQEAIFERFRRGAGATRSDGAGLGLAIVKTIAEAHHGRVELESRSGDGTTFTIIIPVDQPVTEATP
jgi:two-component system OmpR family sensor kinase